MWYRSAAWFVRTPRPTDLSDRQLSSGSMARRRKVRDNLDG